MKFTDLILVILKNCFNDHASNVFSEFSDSCHSYIGPHSTACLSTMWLQTGCVDGGQGSPSNMETFYLDKLKSQNLQYTF